MTGSVISYSERADLAGEVAAAATELAKASGAVPIALELDVLSHGLLAGGSALVVKGDATLEDDADSAAEALATVARTKGLRALLVGETRFGLIVAAKVAARLRSGLIGKGKVLRIEGENLIAERDVYGGKFTATVSSKLPCVAVVQAGAYRPVDSRPERVETMRVSTSGPRVNVVATKKSQSGAASIKSASVIVAAGRGFARKEDLALAQELAKALGGAVGCSRPLSSDLGWMGEEAHIGLTGVYVHPKLYVAVGISGQLQHVAGIRDSKVIVAINKDSQAPIFQVADYGIVGDLYEVVPAITKALAHASG